MSTGSTHADNAIFIYFKLGGVDFHKYQVLKIGAQYMHTFANTKYETVMHKKRWWLAITQQSTS